MIIIIKRYKTDRYLVLMWQIQPDGRRFTTGKVDKIFLNKRIFNDRQFVRNNGLKDRFERVTSHSSDFTGSH